MENEKLFLLHSTEGNTGRKSYNLVGVFSTKSRAITAANEFDGYNLSPANIKQLEDNNQTQGLEMNYIIETRILNQIS